MSVEKNKGEINLSIEALEKELAIVESEIREKRATPRLYYIGIRDGLRRALSILTSDANQSEKEKSV